MKKNKNGFTVVEVLIVILMVSILGFAGWRVVSTQKTGKTENNSITTSKQAESTKDTLIWQQTESGWQATEKAPECAAQPLLSAPTDFNQVTSVLYPGQKRGGQYKPHGGLRFDNSKDNKIEVIAPMDGFLVKGGSYIAEGEVQYTFDVMNNCGIMFRLGHLRELPANLQKIADTWPTSSSSSALQPINPVEKIKKGELMASKVGLIESNNVFFDLGVYDYRQTNEASKSAAFQQAHNEDKELSWHAVCWLNGWLPSAEQDKLLHLPASDSTSGKTNDYCS